MTPTIHVLGLGAGDLNQLPLGIYKRVIAAKHLYVRTAEHPVLNELAAEGVTYESFDDVYVAHGNFDDVYSGIAAKLVTIAKEQGEIIYAVPGHPLVAERTVQILLENAEKEQLTINIEGGQSFLDPLFAALKVDPIEGFTMLDATSLRTEQINPQLHTVIAQVYDQLTASDVKLSLMDVFPDEYEITVCTAVGVEGMEKIDVVPLYELDRVDHLGNLSLVYVPPTTEESVRYRQFSYLKEIIAVLRSPEGCPWDRKQTHQTLRKYLIEEAYEVLEAIDNDDLDALSDELGDLLLQIMLHSQIASEDGYFTIEDVIANINSKMIRRHPHVFGEASADNAEEVVVNWQQIKEQEKAEKGIDTTEESKLAGIPRELPALMYAAKLQKKAAEVGFDWDNIADVFSKIEEEYNEVKTAKPEEQAGELGDLLFAVVNLARFLKVDPEEALRMTNQKFHTRFAHIEMRLREAGRTFAETSLEEMDKWWDEAKKLSRDNR
ncbi:nucleoside triphosphate pyrophosphohydrolase [Brevibacillus dissolubilis]|uniref:nucleoside triphosphate pyrophosphohydrolase n=1 Tax=Brevibacillus dissolubilis TaxID=1844116 RepID=UPI0011175E3B|nr:nucleoside triphosphate pyrophosphohydrolase [Brevibacillus dissolubilis]